MSSGFSKRPYLGLIIFAALFAVGSTAVLAENAGFKEKDAVPEQMLPRREPPVINAPDALPLKSDRPLSARITFDIDNIVEQEKLPLSLSPIMIDATRQNRLSLDQTLSIAIRRNLPYLQTKWLGRQYLSTFAGSVGGLNPFFISRNAQNQTVSSAPNFRQAATQISQGQQAQLFSQNEPLTRLRYGQYGFYASTGGQAIVPLFTNLFQWRAASANVRTSMQDALFQATNNYFELCKQISLLHVANIVVENAKGILELNQGLVESGMGTRLQLLQAKTQLAAYREHLVSQQVQARVAAINLGVTLNLPLSDYFLPDARPLDKTTLVDPKLTAESLVSLALKSRPEIDQKRNLVRQQISQSFQALTPLLPTASYTVQNGKFFPDSGSGQASGQQRSWQLAWQLNSLAVPVGPNFAAGLSAARAADYDLKNLELQVRSQVRAAYDSSLAAETNIEISRQAALDAQEQLKLAEERLEAGIGINIDVIQAQSALTQALQNYVNAVYDYNSQQAKLRRAIGGFTYKSVRAKLRYN